MNFIVTPTGIRDMVNDHTFQDQVDENSLIFVLYEPDDIARISDISLLMDTKASVSYICAPNRDDKLLCIGAIKIRMNCMIFDKELNVETSYFDRIERMCNIISSEADEGKETTSVSGVEQVKQIVETHENDVNVSSVNENEDNNSEDVASENSSSVDEQFDESASSENNESADNVESLDTEEVPVSDNESSYTHEEDSVNSSFDEDDTHNKESNDSNNSNVEQTTGENTELEQNDDVVEEHAESQDNVSESIGAAPDDVKEPDVDSMLEEKENDSVDDEVAKSFDTDGENVEEQQKSEEYNEEPLPEGTKKHPFDTRNSNGLDDRQQAMYNILRMGPPKEGAMTLGEYINAIISIVTLTEDESLIESKIYELENGSIVWTRIKDCLDDVREIAR